jgi:hypothetical protein
MKKMSSVYKVALLKDMEDLKHDLSVQNCHFIFKIEI